MQSQVVNRSKWCVFSRTGISARAHASQAAPEAFSLPWKWVFFALFCLFYRWKTNTDMHKNTENWSFSRKENASEAAFASMSSCRNTPPFLGVLTRIVFEAFSSVFEVLDEGWAYANIQLFAFVIRLLLTVPPGKMGHLEKGTRARARATTSSAQQIVHCMLKCRHP